MFRTRLGSRLVIKGYRTGLEPSGSSCKMLSRSRESGSRSAFLTDVGFFTRGICSESAIIFSALKLFEIAKYIELSLTNTELESLLHEQFLIKKYKPKFNVQFKDDKGYPWIKVETDKTFPAAKSFLGKEF